MWVVAKIKASEANIFKNKLTLLFGKNIKFYSPKICFQKLYKNKLINFEKELLESYIFCYHEKFIKASAVNEIQFIRGLQYFLKGYVQSQKEIRNFIDYCKSYENNDGYLKPIFFKQLVSKRAQFISGPFTNTMFEIIDRQKNKLKILIGNIVTTISDNKNYLYRSI